MLDLRTRIEMRVAHEFGLSIETVKKSPDLQAIVDQCLDEMTDTLAAAI